MKFFGANIIGAVTAGKVVPAVPTVEPASIISAAVSAAVKSAVAAKSAVVAAKAATAESAAVKTTAAASAKRVAAEQEDTKKRDRDNLFRVPHVLCPCV